MFKLMRPLVAGLLVAWLLNLAVTGRAQRRAPAPPPPPPPAAKKVPAPPAPPAAPPISAAPAGTAPAKVVTTPAVKKPAVWGNKADDAADASGVRGLTPLADRDAKLVFAPYPSPMVAIGPSIFDMAAGKEVGKVAALPKDVSAKFALSPSGKFFAQTNKEMYHIFVEVIDTATGEVKHKLEYAEGDFQDVVYMTFTKHNHLVAVVPAKPSGAKIVLWRMDDGKPLKQVPIDRLDDRKIAFSDNGQYLASVIDSRLVVFDVSKGKVLAEMQKPPQESGILNFIFLSSIAFSPDTSELAGIMTGKDAAHHLVVWGADGKIVEQYNLGLTIRPGYYLDGPIQWAPDGQGFLLHGDCFFDRGLKALAWIMRPPVQHNYPHRFLDNEHVISTRGDFSSRQLVSVEIPRQAIAGAASSLNSGTAALLKPGDTVQLKVEVGGIRFSDPGAVQAEMEKSITRRLGDGNLRVGGGGSIVLSVKYSEAAGTDLRVVEGGPFRFNQRDTGQTVQETVGQLEAKLTSGGKVIWETTLQRGNPYHIDAATVNDAAVRDAMFRGVNFMLTTMQLPYFVPADEKAIRLPITVSLEQ